MYRILTLISVCISLAACGSDSGVPAPLFSSGAAPASLTDVQGQTFPLRIARSVTDDAGATYTLDRTNYSLRFTGAGALELDTPGGTVAMTEAGGNYTGALAGNTYSLQLAGLAGFSYSEGLLLQFTDGVVFQELASGQFGLQTPTIEIDANVAGSLVAGYSGVSSLFLQTPSGVAYEEGSAGFLVDFGTQTIAGSLFVGTDTSVNITNGTIVGNRVTGSATIDAPPGVIATVTASDVDGYFYGQGGIELDGSFEGTGTFDGDPISFVGSFYTID